MGSLHRAARRHALFTGAIPGNDDSGCAAGQLSDFDLPFLRAQSLSAGRVGNHADLTAAPTAAPTTAAVEYPNTAESDGDTNGLTSDSNAIAHPDTGTADADIHAGVDGDGHTGSANGDGDFYPIADGHRDPAADGDLYAAADGHRDSGTDGDFYTAADGDLDGGPDRGEYATADGYLDHGPLGAGSTMKRSLCIIPGDGIGQEVIPAAVRVLEAVIPDLEVVEAEAGYGTFQAKGDSVPAETLVRIESCRAALFGAVGSPPKKIDGYRSAIITMRRALDLYANIRPVRSLPLNGLRQDVDLVIFRENTEDVYAGREWIDPSGEKATAERLITRRSSFRIARSAFSFARQYGRRRVTIVHKANVMPLTDGLFRACCLEVAAGFAEIEVEEMLADIAAYWLVRDPARFDVVVTTNLFGDILSDAAAHWGGGIGLVPSINQGDRLAVAEPVHGSAPDIAGRGIANPLAAILSAALLVRNTWQLVEPAGRIEEAVRQLIFQRDNLTPDLGGKGTTATVVDRLLSILAV